MPNLRPYQNESVSLLQLGFKEHGRQVLCLPTGAGKTVVFSYIVQLAAYRGTRSLVVTDRIELFKQTFRALGRVGTQPQIINAEFKGQADSRALVTVAMVETLKRRISSGKIHLEPELIIIDEAHKKNFNAVIDLFPDAYVIGATATPIGAHFWRYYTNIVNNIDIPELVEQGYLVPCEAYQMEENLSDLRTRAGEYTADSLNDHYNKSSLFGGVIRSYREKADGLKTLVFNCNIKHAHNMTQAFNDAGIRSKCITSKTPKAERDAILAEFSRGDFPVLNNCGILTTGYDEPSIECIIMNRATKSLTLWLQCCGRGSRIFPGKSRFIVLDFGLNHNAHGAWQQPRKWNLVPPRKKSAALDVTPVKDCPSCGAIIFASAKKCEFCSYEYPEEDKELRDGVLVRIPSGSLSDIRGKKLSELTLEELAGLQRMKRFKAHFLWRVVRARGTDAIAEYARIMGYGFGWRLRQNDYIENSSFVNIEIK